MKFLFSLIVALTIGYSVGAHALTQTQILAAQSGLNRASPGAMAKHRLGDLEVKAKKHVAKGSYSFAIAGGAIGPITLKDEDGKALALPKNAIVSDCLIDVITAPTSSGLATIAFGTGQSTTDLKAATAIASITGLVACVPVGSAATAIKLTADRGPLITVAAFALTAGKFNVLIEYWLSDPQ